MIDNHVYFYYDVKIFKKNAVIKKKGLTLQQVFFLEQKILLT